MSRKHYPPNAKLRDFEVEALSLVEQRRAGVDAATELSKEFVSSNELTLDSARKAIANNYGVESWERLVIGCQMVEALQANDINTVRELVEENPNLLHENARGTDSNWGAPMSFAANLGHDEMIRMLAEQGATDFQHAFSRACLQGKIHTAQLLLSYGAKVEHGIVMGPCETLNADGLDLLLQLGAELCDSDRNGWAPIAMLLETYSRDPDGKHRCLQLAADKGVQFPESPIVAFHQGRLDLLQEHLRNDPDLPHRRFSLREIYPLILGCHDHVTCGLHGTSLDGTTLLHMCVDFDEMEIAHWLIENGADVNAEAEPDADGFGRHTPLFNAVVSQANLCGRQTDASMARLLLEHGSDPSRRASVRKQLKFWEDETMHEYLDVSPWKYGEQFHATQFVNEAVMELIAKN